MMKMLVTGATGKIGRYIVAQLLRAGTQVRALTRNPAAANLPDGVEVVAGDLTQPQSLLPALEDVECLYLIPVPETAAEVVALAKQAGVRRIVALSSASAPFEDKYHPRGQYFLRVERAVEAADVEWTHLRPGGLMSSALGWADSIRREGVVRAPYGNASYPHIHEADVADAAVAALLEDGHIGKKYILTGPESITQIEQVKTISAAIGRQIRFEELTPDEARKLWRQYMPDAEIDVELMVLGESIGKPVKARPSIEQVTGRKGRNFAQWAIEHAQNFQ